MAVTAEAERRTQTICLLILTGIALAAAMRAFAPVLIPFVLAILFTSCLTPLIDFQRRRLRLPRFVAIATTVTLGCVLVALGLLVASTVSEITQHAERYQDEAQALFVSTAEWLPLDELGLDTEELRQSVLRMPGRAAATLITGALSGVMSVISNGLLVIIFMIFMVAGRGAAPAAPAGGVLGEIEVRTKRYLIAMLFTSGLTGLLVGLTLTFLGVPFAVMFGLLAFLLNFIPNIGSVIATLLPLPVALLSPELSSTAKVLAIAIPGTIQFTIGNLLQPRIMGRSLDLHPVAVLMSLVFFGIIWGIVGMFLATPITAVLKTLFERFEHTRPAARVLAGRLAAPAEPPVGVVS